MIIYDEKELREKYGKCTIEELNARLDKAEEDEFYNNMVDRWSHENYMRNAELNYLIGELKAAIKLVA